MNKTTLTPLQLGFAILFCKLFSLLTFTPSQNTPAGSTSLFAVPLSGGITILIVIILAKTIINRGYNSFEELSNSLNKYTKFILYFTFSIYAVFIIATTSGEFTSFLQTTVFKQDSIFLYTILFLICTAYSGIGGANSVGGVSLFGVLFIVPTFLLMAFSLTPNIGIYNIMSPFENGYSEFNNVVMFWALSFGEIVFLFLLSKSFKGTIKSAIIGILGSVIIYTIITFLSLTVFGDYALTSNYPVYLLSRISSIGFISRMEIVYIIIWVLSCVIRVITVMYAVTIISNNKNKNKYLVALFIISAVISLYLSYNFDAILSFKPYVYLEIIPFLTFAIIAICKRRVVYAKKN